MDKKQLFKFRKKAGIPKPGMYLSQRHPKAAPRPQYHGPNRKYSPIKPRTGTFRHRSFTESEIEATWIALCKLIDFVSGSRKLLVQLSGLSYYLVSQYIKRGRISADGAHIIGMNSEFPFTREELRPDIDQEGWRKFDEYWKNSLSVRNKARRISKEADQISI